MMLRATDHVFLCRVVRPAVEGQTLGYGHVELPPSGFARRLRELQLESAA